MSDMHGGRLAGWQFCQLCKDNPKFQSTTDFLIHLKSSHCDSSRGTFVCRYAKNGLCEMTAANAGVSEKDFEYHVLKEHLRQSQEDCSDVAEWDSRSDISSNVERMRLGQMCRSSQSLSAVLNDPRKSRLNVQNFFVRYWGESFVESAEIPPLFHVRKVTWRTFEDYIARIPSLYERHANDEKQVLRCSLSSGSTNRLAQTAVDTLSTDIPKMFFNPSFSLSDSSCFDALSSLAKTPTDCVQIVPTAGGGRKNLSVDWSAFSRLQRSQRENKALQEQLGACLDKVEIEIARHLSTKSQAFFQLMSFHDQLQKQISSASGVIRVLREQMSEIEEVQCGRWLRLIAMRNRRARIGKLLKKLDLIGTVVQTQQTVQSLLNSGDYTAALELVSTTRAVLNEELKGVTCFRHLCAELSEMQVLIGKLLLNEFVQFLKSELSQPMVDKSSLDFDQYHLRSIVTGLLKQKQLNFCSLIKDEALAVIKLLVRQTAREYINLHLEMDNENVQNVAEVLRQCSFDKWLLIFTGVCQAVLLFCEKMTLVLKSMHHLVSIASVDRVDKFGIEESLPPSSLQMLTEVKLSQFDRDTLFDAMADLLPQVGTFAQERLCRVISARGKEDFFKSLTADDFVAFATTVQNMDMQFQKLIGGLATSALRIQLRCLADSFIARFHEDRKTKLTNIIDSENWQRAEVPKLFQDIVDEYETTGKLTDVSMDASAQPTRTYRSYLSVNGEKFVVIGTVLILLQIIVQYCQLMHLLPMYAASILSYLVEVLKMYNSRSCQLILGAGAMQMVGLKTISSVHLALSCRSLQLISHFIPIVGSVFEAKLPDESRHLSRHFAQLLKDYKDHANEVLGQISTVLESCVETSMAHWTLTGSVPSPQFSRLAKQVKRLYDSNHDILTAKDLQDLMWRLYNTLRKAVLDTLEKQGIDVREKPAEYAFASDDVNWLLRNIQRLPCCAGISQIMTPILS